MISQLCTIALKCSSKQNKIRVGIIENRQNKYGGLLIIVEMEGGYIGVLYFSLYFGIYFKFL